VIADRNAEIESVNVIIFTNTALFDRVDLYNACTRRLPVLFSFLFTRRLIRSSSSTHVYYNIEQPSPSSARGENFWSRQTTEVQSFLTTLRPNPYNNRPRAFRIRIQNYLYLFVVVVVSESERPFVGRRAQRIFHDRLLINGNPPPEECNADIADDGGGIAGVIVI